MAESEQERKRFDEFLMGTPPAKEVFVLDVAKQNVPYTKQPTIKLYCDNAMCQAEMWFDCDGYEGQISTEGWQDVNLKYICRHCKTSQKWFALLVWRKTVFAGLVKKIGAIPPFGPHTPSRVISLVAKDRELFLKGRQSEARGLGIGAFAYYRRVVDNNWKRLLQAAIKVAKKLNLPTEILVKAEAEHQFSKAVKMVKDAIPQVLLVDGHNPMTILYKTLSEGVHDLNDEQCLELAKHIRVVLVDFTDRVGEALKERKELQNSLTKLFQSDKPQEPSENMDSQKDDKSEDDQQEKAQQ